MSTVAEIQAAVCKLTLPEQYEFSKWLLTQMEREPLTEEMTDAVAVERFRALDAEEADHAQGTAR
ncbi:MAG: hypothetical protein FJ387_28415 [Verrucomicrobia bacterium]|nr:hypothetical protein [Verrucomicrobiota bacterium]